MQILSINIRNYRAHENLEVNFNDSFNVITGINGSGKTSLLNGIMETINCLMTHTRRPHTSILEDEECAHIKNVSYNGRIRFEKQFPYALNTIGKYAAGFFTSRIYKEYETDIPHLNTDYDPELPYDGTSSDNRSLPVFAYYRAHRRWISGKSEVIRAALDRPSRYDGYDKWWDAAYSSANLQQWIIAKSLERYQISSETGRKFDNIKGDELSIINNALSSAIDNINHIRYDMQQKSLLVEWEVPKKNTRKLIPFTNLSDGQRGVICLVADIARRICLLNPNLGSHALRKTAGVILIDELDVHLHPSWQRKVVSGLKNAFPLVQFIVTSHSPQVLGEVRPDEIILLSEGETSRPEVSYGLDSSQILQEIMDTSPRNLEVEDRINEIFLAIKNHDLEKAKKLLNQLNIISPQLPEISKATALIRRMEIIGR